MDALIWKRQEQAKNKLNRKLDEHWYYEPWVDHAPLECILLLSTQSMGVRQQKANAIALDDTLSCQSKSGHPNHQSIEGCPY